MTRVIKIGPLQVNPEDLSNDLDPKFTSEFYRNMKILSLDLYKKTAALNTQGGGGGGGLTAGAGPAGAASSFSLGNSKSKGALSLAAMRGRKLQQINTDFPAIADGNKGVDLAALALESPSGSSISNIHLLNINSSCNIGSRCGDQERVHDFTNAPSRVLQHGEFNGTHEDVYTAREYSSGLLGEICLKLPTECGLQQRGEEHPFRFIIITTFFS